MERVVLKTNVTTDVVYDEIKSAFKSDKRIWSLDREERSDGYLLFIDAEVGSAEIISTINSLGFEATVV